MMEALPPALDSVEFPARDPPDQIAGDLGLPARHPPGKRCNEEFETDCFDPFRWLSDCEAGGLASEAAWRSSFRTVRELDLDYARDTLRNLARIWGRPVHIQTVLGEMDKLLTHDGLEFREREL
jgi:hypothetical protein